MSLGKSARYQYVDSFDDSAGKAAPSGQGAVCTPPHHHPPGHRFPIIHANSPPMSFGSPSVAKMLLQPKTPGSIQSHPAMTPVVHVTNSPLIIGGISIQMDSSGNMSGNVSTGTLSSDAWQDLSLGASGYKPTQDRSEFLEAITPVALDFSPEMKTPKETDFETPTQKQVIPPTSPPLAPKKRACIASGPEMMGQAESENAKKAKVTDWLRGNVISTRMGAGADESDASEFVQDVAQTAACLGSEIPTSSSSLMSRKKSTIFDFFIESNKD